MKSMSARSIIALGFASSLVMGLGCKSGGGSHHGHDARDGQGKEHVEEGEEQDEDKSEDVIAFADAPAPVQEAFHRVAPGATPSKVLREVDEGVTTFEIEYTANGHASSLTTTPTGDVLESEQGMDVSALPAAVLQALKHEFPKGTIGTAELLTTHAYECEIVVNGKKHAVTVDASGNIDEEEED